MLDGFFIIESWRIDSGNLSVRLVPDHFESGLSDPVVTIFVTEVRDPVQCEASLAQRKAKLIVDLQVSEGLAAVFVEHDDDPVSLRGASVVVTRGPYSFENLCNVIQQQDEELRRCYDQLRVYRSTIDGADGFVSELIRRAEIKRELTSRDAGPLELEIDVLRRVLQRIRER